jgi:hypothetical protein
MAAVANGPIRALEEVKEYFSFCLFRLKVNSLV